MRFLALWVGLSAGLWGSCGIDPHAPLWLHGHALVLARPVMENGEKTLYKVDRVLWGMEKAPEELMIPDTGYVKELPYKPRPVEDSTPVVVAVPRHRITNQLLRRRWGACDVVVFSTKFPEVRDFLNGEANEWKADLRIRTYVNGDERVLAGMRVLVRGEGETLNLLSDEKGIAMAKGLTPGRYLVSVADSLYERQPIEVELTPRGGGTLQLGLASPTLVSGRVLDAQGRPEARRVLWLRRDREVRDFFGGRGERRMLSGADGSFSAKGMPAGEYYLESEAPVAYYAGARAYARNREGALKITVRDGQPVEGLEFRLPD